MGPTDTVSQPTLLAQHRQAGPAGAADPIQPDESSVASSSSASSSGASSLARRSVTVVPPPSRPRVGGLLRGVRECVSGWMTRSGAAVDRALSRFAHAEWVLPSRMNRAGVAREEAQGRLNALVDGRGGPRDVRRLKSALNTMARASAGRSDVAPAPLSLDTAALTAGKSVDDLVALLKRVDDLIDQVAVRRPLVEAGRTRSTPEPQDPEHAKDAGIADGAFSPARRALQNARNDINDHLYARLVDERRDAQAQAWTGFEKLLGSPESADMPRALALAEVVRQSTGFGAVLQRAVVRTPAGFEDPPDGQRPLPGHPLELLHLTVERLASLTPEQRAPLLPLLPRDVLTNLPSFLKRPVEAQPAFFPELAAEVRAIAGAVPHRLLVTVGAICGYIDGALPPPKFQPLPAVSPRGSDVTRPRAGTAARNPALRDSGQGNAGVGLGDHADTVMRWLEEASLALATVERHCDTYDIDRPADLQAVRDRVRHLGLRLVQEPEHVLAEATLPQLWRMNRLVRLMGLPGDNFQLRSRCQHFARPTNDAVREQFDALSDRLLAPTMKPGKLLRELHAYAQALGKAQRINAALGLPVAPVDASLFTHLVAQMNTQDADWLLQALSGPETAPYFGVAALQGAATAVHLRGGFDTPRLMLDVLEGLRGALRERIAQAGDAGDDESASDDLRVDTTEPAAGVFQDLFGIEPASTAADAPRTGSFDAVSSGKMRTTLEQPLSADESVLVKIEDAAMPKQFLKDGRRAHAHGQGTQFYMPDGSPVIDLSSTTGEPLSEEEVEQRVRDGFARLAALFGSDEVARAVTAYAQQGIIGSTLGVLAADRTDSNPFHLGDVVGMPIFKNGTGGAMTLAITFRLMPDGRPGFSVNYRQQGGALQGVPDPDSDDPSSPTVHLHPERSRLAIDFDVVWRSDRAIMPGVDEGKLTHAGHVEVVGEITYATQLVGSDFQRDYAKPARIEDLRPRPTGASPGAVVRGNGQLEFIAHARRMEQAHQAGGAPWSATAEALFCLWDFEREPSPLNLERVLVRLRALPADAVPPALREAAHLRPLTEQTYGEQQKLRTVFGQAGVRQVLRTLHDDAKARVDEKRNAFMAAHMAQEEAASPASSSSSSASRPFAPSSSDSPRRSPNGETPGGPEGTSSSEHYAVGLAKFVSSMDSVTWRDNDLVELIEALNDSPTIEGSRALFKKVRERLDPDEAMNIERTLEEAELGQMTATNFVDIADHLSASLAPALTSMVTEISGEVRPGASASR